MWVYYVYEPDTGEPLAASGSLQLPPQRLLHADSLVPNRITNSGPYLAVSPPGGMHEPDASKWTVVYAISPDDLVDLAFIFERCQERSHSTNSTRRDMVQRFVRDVQDPEVG